MRRINFFSPYIVRTRAGGKKAGVFQGLAIAVILILLGTYGFNWYAISRAISETQEMTAFMTEPKNLEAVKKYNETERKYNALKQYNGVLNEITSYVDKRDVINSVLLGDLNGTIPKEVFLQGTNLDIKALDIQGVSQNRTAIAEYQYNLKNLALFKRVFVTSIMTNQSEEGSTDLIFSLKTEFEGGGSQ